MSPRLKKNSSKLAAYSSSSTLIAEGPLAARAATTTPVSRAELHSGDTLANPLARSLLDLMRRNLDEICGASWDADEKREELCHPETQIVTLRQGASLLGFASYRITQEEGVDVAYLYELHLETSARGLRYATPHATPAPPRSLACDRTLLALALLGLPALPAALALPAQRAAVSHLGESRLGSALVDEVERRGRDAGVHGLMLTVHTRNEAARRFYKERHSFEVSPISPALCAPPFLAAGCDYEVLQSIWDDGARRQLQRRGAAARQALYTQAIEDGRLKVRLVMKGGSSGSSNRKSGSSRADAGVAQRPIAKRRGDGAVRKPRRALAMDVEVEEEVC